MSEQAEQNLANHAKVPGKIMVLTLIALITIILGAIGMYTKNIQIVSAGVILAGIGIILTSLTSRLYSTTLQDRIIRTEMKIRLHDVLDTDLLAKAKDLTLGQLVAIRFASDAEMHGIVQKVVDETITKGGDIKKLVTDWQADHHRV